MDQQCNLYCYYMGMNNFITLGMFWFTIFPINFILTDACNIVWHELRQQGLPLIRTGLHLPKKCIHHLQTIANHSWHRWTQLFCLTSDKCLHFGVIFLGATRAALMWYYYTLDDNKSVKMGNKATLLMSHPFPQSCSSLAVSLLWIDN